MPKEGKAGSKLDYEHALSELEGVVKQLEAGDLSLDRSIELFQRGVELAKECKRKLDQAELKVNQLVKDKDGLFREEPIDAADGSEQ